MPSTHDLIPVERRQCILHMLQQQHILTIQELVDKLHVSHMTIRRDLRALEMQGMLVQVSGGAQLVRKLVSEPSHLQKETLSAAQKDAIGKAAAKLISPHACIYLDAGTTSLALCRYLCDRQDLTIVSNDFEVINFLIKNFSGKLLHTGGFVRKENCSCIGHLAAQTLQSLSFDISFISASSWELKGITTPDMDKVPVKQAAAKASRRVILIADSSKYAQTATYIALPLTAFNSIITDKGLPENAQKQINKLDLELILV